MLAHCKCNDGLFYSDPKSKPLGSLSTILITRLLITIIIIDQDTDSKYFCARTGIFNP